MSGLYRQAVHDNLASAGFTEGQADIQFDDAPMESRSTHLRLDTELGTFEATSPNSHLISTIGQEALSSSGLPSTKAPGQLA